MKNVCRNLLCLLSVLLLIFSMGCKGGKSSGHVNGKLNSQKYHIIHIMSYHSPWEWTDSQLKGFQSALSDLDVEYTVFQMDTKRKSSEEWKQQVGKMGRDLIDKVNPDLVYTSDDNAQIYVAKYYVNKDLPFVFSGVNALPEDYGFTGTKNMAGVLEVEHIGPSVKLLQSICPKVRKIAVITDIDPSWPRLIERMKVTGRADHDQYEFVSFDTIETFGAFKRRVIDLQTKADAICFVGIFTFKDEAGRNVPMNTVLKWISDNSRLPDFSFWGDRVRRGTLCSVSVSAYEQGFAAGKISHAIFTEGKKPSDFEFCPTSKGEPEINLARAKTLGIKINSEVLLAARVYDKYNYSNR